MLVPRVPYVPPRFPTANSLPMIRSFPPAQRLRSSSFTVLFISLFFSVVFSSSFARAENWPGWRGPRGDGTSEETDVPTHWDGAKGENIAWKVEVPGTGHASPIVWDDRIFLVTCLEEEPRPRAALPRPRLGQNALADVGAQVAAGKEAPLNSYASSTPATDGKLVYVTFLEGTKPGEATGAADGRGGLRFRRAAASGSCGPARFPASTAIAVVPVLFEDKLIVNGDHDGDAYLVALDRETGKTVWKTPRENKTRSYSTPIIRDIDGRTQMILSGSKCVASYDPRDGSRHWIIDGPTEQFVASLVYNGELLFMTAGFPEHHILAIRPDGHGNVTNTHVAWRTKEDCSYVPSPIAPWASISWSSPTTASPVASRPPPAAALDGADRPALQRQPRLGRRTGLLPLRRRRDDHGQAGREVRGRGRQSELGEACYASPAISQGRIYLRAEKHLYAIGGD